MTDLDRVAYTVPEVATMLGVSRSHVYTMLAEGIIPSLKVGTRKRLIPKDPFDAWLASAATRVS